MLYRPGRVETAERQQMKQGMDRGDKSIEVKNKKLNTTDLTFEKKINWGSRAFYPHAHWKKQYLLLF